MEGRRLAILHVVQSDSSGGAAVAARRLVIAQREDGLDARILVLERNGDEPFVHTPGSSSVRLKARLVRFVSKRACALLARTEKRAMRSLALVPTGLGRAIAALDPDVVHWHWVGAETASLREIAGVAAPAVWTCHDQWVFCGAEHYAPDDRFIAGYASAGLDPDALTFHRKVQAWRGWRPTLVCPSHWMRAEVGRSLLGREWPAVVIPNTFDFDALKPRDRLAARRRVGLPPEVPLILFGAQGGRSDPRKGFDLLLAALRELRQRHPRPFELAVFGGGETGRGEIGGIPTHHLGMLRGDDALSWAYSACEVFAAPSRRENLANAVIEALACGTPCVAFEIGGMPDIITQPLQGALARPFDTSALAAALGEFLCETDEKLRSARHEDARSRFGAERVVSQHRELYEQLCNNESSRRRPLVA